MMASISHEHANQYTGELLPPSPASAPYAIFRQSSETVRTSVIIGLGSKLAVLQAQQVRNITSYNEIDLVLLFTDPNTTDPWDDSQMIETIRHCDRHNVPIATNLASAEMFIMGLQRGDLDWREMLHTKTRF